MRISKGWWQLALVLVWVPAAATIIQHTRNLKDDPISLEVDLSKRQLYVIKDGEDVGSYGIAVGSPSYPTPQGSFSISKIVWNPGWVPPASAWARNETPKAPGEPGNPMVGVKLYFQEPAYYIHGTNNPESIGEAASHGCIRMEVGDAEELANLLMESTGAEMSEESREAVGSGSTRVVTLPSAVSLTIRS